ncbi:heme o synthase [Iamia majanohamensis]|uniref:Protoheme IX farnesyltransferase n=1 Tax=Iamia majanohamensis TaxID=467976 RepID=A0AAF0BVL7_9ACTN|nr:heme o synthase [Iamia majanohamensis]WCO67178.1 heme o synthase [Iamia majanohamensis]
MTSPTTGAATPVRPAPGRSSLLRRGPVAGHRPVVERPAPLAGEAADQGEPTRSKVAAYVALTKPRIIELLLVTTVPTQVVAARGLPSGWLVLWTVLGGALAAGGANTINMVVDRDIDRLMKRTRGRPLVTGEISPRAALTFAIALEVASFALLWGAVNLLSAVLAVSATLFYVFVYTLWLKRTSTQNIVIGGAAGAAPVLIGWSSVTGSLSWAPVVLFAAIFLWTPPHFWCLAVRYRDDYAAADVPMLPVVSSMRAVTLRIVGYTALLWATTLLFAPVADMGTLYLVAAIVLGGAYLALTIDLARDPDPGKAMRLFHWSITYVTLLFGAMALDQLLVGAS